MDTIRTRADLLTNLFQDGQAAASITAQDMRDLIISLTNRAGWADYNDLTTATTPISVTGGGGWVYLTNDEAGSFTNKQWLHPSITDVWDSTANAFDWSELEVNDTVDLRLDLDVTTVSANQAVDVALEMASGHASTYDLSITHESYKTAGTYKVNVYTAVYMGDTTTLNNPAKFKIKSDGNATVRVNGWWCRVGKH